MPKDVDLLSRRRRDQLINQQVALHASSPPQSDNFTRHEESKSDESESIIRHEETQARDNFAEEQQMQTVNPKIPIAASSDMGVSQYEGIESDSSGESVHEKSDSFSMLSASDSNASSDEDKENVQTLSADVAECVKDNLRDSLRAWISKYSVRRRPVNCLLKLLKIHGLDRLPSDVRTLMQTPRNTGAEIVSQDTGCYKHFDLSVVFTKEIRKYFSDIPDEMLININVDGLPLSKSSRSQFWPILILIKAEFPTTPFVAGIYHGESKPKDANKFLEPFVKDMSQILKRGITIDCKNVLVKINAICCDAPARAFVSYVKGHSGYYSCTKCTQKGYQVSHRVTFPRVDCELRTDKSFQLKQQREHHLGISILELLAIGMVSQIALDYMHLVCLGVMKRLIQFWIRGARNVKFSDDFINKLSDLLLSMKEYIPQEFARKPRSLHDCDRWKATEFRQFLLYTGAVILIIKKIPENMLVHFLSLSVAIRILSDPQMCNNAKARDYADSLLKWFVNNYGNLYGEQYLSYNVHNLIHLANEVKKFGSLDEFSCFSFENYLQLMKNKISNSGKPLEEMINRIHEAELATPKLVIKEYPVIHYTSRGKITYLEFDRFIISTKEQDNCCILSDNSAITVHEIISENNNRVYVRGKYLRNIGSLYTIPCDSQILGIFVASTTLLEIDTELVRFPASQIKRKCLKLLYSEKDRTFVVIPILHSHN